MSLLINGIYNLVKLDLTCYPKNNTWTKILMLKIKRSYPWKFSQLVFKIYCLNNYSNSCQFIPLKSLLCIIISLKTLKKKPKKNLGLVKNKQRSFYGKFAFQVTILINYEEFWFVFFATRVNTSTQTFSQGKICYAY